MTITGNKTKGFQIHLGEADMRKFLAAFGGIRIDLIPTKARELRDRLGEAIKAKEV